MAQAQVTNYFLKRKDREIQPAKRSKIDASHTECNSYQNVTPKETIHRLQTRGSKPIKTSENLKTPAKIHKRIIGKLKNDLQSTSQDIRNYTFIKKNDSADLKFNNQNKHIGDDIFQGIATSFIDHSDHTFSTPITKSSIIESSNSSTNSSPRIRKRSRHLPETLPECTSNSNSDFKNISETKRCRRRLILQKERFQSDRIDLSTKKMGETAESVPSHKLCMKTAGTANKLCMNTELPKIKLGPEELRDRLAKCNKLSQLRETFEQINAQKRKIKEFQDNKKKELENNADQTRIKSSEELPAYQRFNALASSQAATLILPYKYRVLEEIFRSTDQIVCLLHNRSEICTFVKLKAGVQELMRKNFQLQHLAQIKSIYPSAYFFRQEKNIPCFGNKKSSDYQLCIYANLYTKDNVMPTDAHKEHSLEDISHSFNIPMNPSKLRDRKALFHNNLIDIVKKHHEIFLSTLVPPVTCPEHIVRWHPKFPVDEVQDVSLSSLPQPPYVLKYNTAQDVLNNTKDTLNDKVRKALEMVARKSEKKETSEEIKTHTILKNSPSALKGISSSLIERIRQKEAAKMEKIMTRNPEDEKKLVMMSRLPEFVRIIRNFFISEKKAAISMDATINMLASSSSSDVATEEIEPHIRMIVEYLPEWLFVVIIRKITFLKIDRNMDINKVCDQLNQKLKERL